MQFEMAYAQNSKRLPTKSEFENYIRNKDSTSRKVETVKFKVENGNLVKETEVQTQESDEKPIYDSNFHPFIKNNSEYCQQRNSERICPKKSEFGS
jgi:hypothetical protein